MEKIVGEAWKKHGQVRILDVDPEDMYGNPWNPQEMDGSTFNRLVQEMAENGLLETPVVVEREREGKHFMIIGGEHRWKASQVLGWKTIACTIYDGKGVSDDQFLKKMVVKLNQLHGKLNVQKFLSMYDDLISQMDEQQMVEAFALTDASVMKEIVKETRKQLIGSGLSSDKVKQYDRYMKEVRTVDDLSSVLNRIFATHGDSLSQNFLVFSYGGRDHLYIECDRKTWVAVSKVVEAVEESKEDMNVVMRGLFKAYGSEEVEEAVQVDVE